ncbi:MAG TPA: VOC family protein [Acidimicrobiales bacterium]|jgi:glyoxylase I family protein|nr:VOC family protein [Acidimicrobiales bacterium]
MTEVLGYHHLSLSVTDLGKSTEWYQQVLGLELVAEIEGQGFRRNRLRAAGSGVTLTLTAHDHEWGEPFDERRPGLDHVAFAVGSGQDVEALKGEFDRLGVISSEVKSTQPGTALITLRDPDNIQVEVFGGPSDPVVSGG